MGTGQRDTGAGRGGGKRGGQAEAGKRGSERGGAINNDVHAIAARLLRPCAARFWLRSLKEVQEADRRHVRPQSSDGGGNSSSGDRAQTQPQPPAPTAVAVEMVRSVGPLVCTYRRADGWREAACTVCLAELADGEAVRVLPACTHYFHTECVSEWLRAHHTCPLFHAAAAA
ncbi:hypothetical protein BAE44_0023887 [Dichanthelium oligosanthes]|uniref:RING-type domain-containing protein n=1 Tax=Dichanthelium oligosanthes TaxID=888268 RepID=A0A1E5UQG5_9POAL|nr:hypothetical protein BAE44_0023887 [Dichanthelium oligosanthes]